MNETLPSEAAGVESLVSRLTDEFLDRLDRGERPGVEEYAARHPQVAFHTAAGRERQVFI